jgi:uncharacterized membrane protein
MFGIPLHPLIVHFPIVLTFLLPISALVALWAIRKGTTPRRAWAVPVAMAAALTLSALAAVKSGEAEEERAEGVVSESVLHGHEEAAERFLMLSGVLVLVAAAGLLPKTVGQAARLVATAGATGLIIAAAQVGHSGGTLVYRHGAASAYAEGAPRVGERGGDIQTGRAKAARPIARDEDERRP